MNDIDILEEQAVDAAVGMRWKDAIFLNEKILHLDSKNLSACLRMGFAYLQVKNNKEAKKYYQKALRIQPKNQVASENLERIKILGERGSGKSSSEQARLDPSLFLDVPGKTKSVALVNVGQKQDLAKLVIGQEVELKLKKRKVEARGTSGSYIGSLPDDLSKRLIYFLKAKSKYLAYIKESNLNRVVLFIREIGKGKKVAHYSSFPQNIQTNINRMNDETQAEHEEEENEDEEWDNLTHELTVEEKEELADIHQEEEESEE